MQRKLIPILVVGLFLGGCRMQRANRLLSGDKSSAGLVTPAVSPTDIATARPTGTPAPTATVTPTPTPDLSLIGLPSEQARTTAFDFVSEMCNAQWFTKAGDLPCPGNEAQADAGYIMQLNGAVQNLPSNIDLLLMFPPRTNVETISSKYPPFKVEKGDRFRAVLGCRAHTFCDVEFILDYFDGHGHTGLTHWHYLFTDQPLVIDYSLDGLAGKTVQFDLAVRAGGNRLDASAVWIAPHVYRPSD